MIMNRHMNLICLALAVLLCAACGGPKVNITPFGQLNQGDSQLNSHAGASVRSSIKPMKHTLTLLPPDTTSLKWPS